MEIQFDYLKFKDAVHYIAHRCPASKLGRVKMHKTLYFSDMLSYVASGKPLTGATYRRQPKGPMAVELGRAINELKADGAIEV
ncbi:MAG: type II toxin-antitoxin system antitoxin SocA domain-containing protein, partial [Sandaracinobacteroides sp.]